MLSARASSPFAAIARERWRELGGAGAALAYDELAGPPGLGEPVAVDEVSDVYALLARLVALRVEAAQALSQAQNAFLGEAHRVPFLVALAGSVAVGKSTAARLIVRLLASLRPGWQVELVTTDGFLLPNATLIERVILARKGFPESYDRRRLPRFVADLKSGLPEVRAPIYSHLRYFHRYAQLSDEEALAVATGIWERTNRPNLLENIQPTRPRADVILRRGPDHFVSRVVLRRT